MPRSRSWSLESMARSATPGCRGRRRTGQQLVDQGGLAVVDVGDDGDVAKGHAGSAKSYGPRRGPACGRNIVQPIYGRNVSVVL